jgi:exodeoxyribonuclease VII small subunit
MNKKENSFEEALLELDSIIDKLENGQISMDELKSSLLRSQQLIDLCRARLRELPPLLEKLNDQLN